MTAERKKVLVLDDQEGRNQAWKDKLESSMGAYTQKYEIEFKDTTEIEKAMNQLHQRRSEAREGKRYSLEDNLFDAVDMLFVDYDLFELDKKQDVTGELLAYLARCYSSCGLIVAVNQFERGGSVFDLNLSGHPEAFADVHLAEADLGNSGLWTQTPQVQGGFRPWYWPHLPTAQKNLESRAEKLENNLSEKVLAYFGLEENMVLPTYALEMLTKKDSPMDVDFQAFVESSGLGLRTKDKVSEPRSIARIAASRIGKWLETAVLPGQNVLIDAPHLAYRFPSLISDSDNLELWNRTTELVELDSNSIRREEIDIHAFEKTDWLSRPAWFWREVSTRESIPEVADPGLQSSRNTFSVKIRLVLWPKRKPKALLRPWIPPSHSATSKISIASPTLLDSFSHSDRALRFGRRTQTFQANNSCRLWRLP